VRMMGKGERQNTHLARLMNRILRTTDIHI